MPTYTRKDVCTALCVDDHRVRQWMNHAPFAERPATPRSPRRFDLQDLVLLALACDLEERYGLKGRVFGRVLPALDAYLRRPRSPKPDERIVLSVESWQVEDILPSSPLVAGFIIDVAKARERIGLFLGVVPIQRELALGPGRARYLPS